jgi:hypothetical protein
MKKAVSVTWNVQNRWRSEVLDVYNEMRACSDIEAKDRIRNGAQEYQPI